jgi:hypothetical protein
MDEGAPLSPPGPGHDRRAAKGAFQNMNQMENRPLFLRWGGFVVVLLALGVALLAARSAQAQAAPAAAPPTATVANPDARQADPLHEADQRIKGVPPDTAVGPNPTPGPVARNPFNQAIFIGPAILVGLIIIGLLLTMIPWSGRRRHYRRIQT